MQKDYSIDWRLNDFAFAEKQGKKLLELSLVSDGSYSDVRRLDKYA